MIEQSVEEVTAAMKQNPKVWAAQYIDLLQQCNQLQQKHNDLVLALLPVRQTTH